MPLAMTVLRLRVRVELSVDSTELSVVWKLMLVLEGVEELRRLKRAKAPVLMAISITKPAARA